MKLSRVNSEVQIRLEKLDTELASDLVVSGFFAFERSLFFPQKIIGNDQGRRLPPNFKNHYFTKIFSFQNVFFKFIIFKFMIFKFILNLLHASSFLFFNNSFKIYDRG